MEGTIIESAYLGLGVGDKALNRILKLKDICYRVHGCFSLLWHNSSLVSNEIKRDVSMLFEELISIKIILLNLRFYL